MVRNASVDHTIILVSRAADVPYAPWIHLGEEVRSALNEAVPVVALESVIFSALGLPEPDNRRCYQRVTTTVRGGGAVPAVVGVIDGRAVVGASDSEIERLLGASVKLAARDIGPALAAKLQVGATTVSASIALAAMAGIEVFATGGIGGVHRGAATTGDVSQDLVALSRHGVMVVSSGVKSFLDVALTLEHLESLGVPVVGWRTDRFPAFYLRDSGLGVPWTVSNAEQAVAAFRVATLLGRGVGMLIANPIPAAAELDRLQVTSAIERSLNAISGDAMSGDVVSGIIGSGDAVSGMTRRGVAGSGDVVSGDVVSGVTGPGVTPAVLKALAEATSGETVEANLALAHSNACVAAELAVAAVQTR